MDKQQVIERARKRAKERELESMQALKEHMDYFSEVFSEKNFNPGPSKNKQSLTKEEWKQLCKTAQKLNS